MHSKIKITALDIASVAMMVATILAGKWALNSLPNIEVVTLFFILYTVYFGRLTGFAVGIFLAVEGILYGIGWWFYAYLFVWPLLFILVLLLRRHANYINMAILSGVFGFSFGLLCEIPYSLMFGIKAGFAWWIAGIPYDVIHGISNFILCLVLYKPLISALKATKLYQNT